MYVPVPPAVGGGGYGQFERDESMTTKEKAPVSAATLAEAKEKAVKEASIPNSYFTTTDTGRQMKIADFLSHGPENGQTITDLEKLTDWKSREIRRQIERERRSGTLIISDNKNGYFLASDPAEVQQFTRSMRHRAREILRTVRAIEEAAGID